MRNLTKSIVTASLLMPMAAHSLGVGEIKLHSALNQKLNAEIALTLSAGEHVDDIKVNLATPDQFDKLGIAWSYFISKVKFKTIVKSNGQVVIKVTSEKVLQEPILDFLVEVSWPKGEIYKEYTVLVDPPVVYQQSVTATPVVPVATPKKVVKRSGPAPAPRVQNDFSSLAVKGEYGPTNRNDSLWKVAKKVNKHSDVSVEQMMMALYKANPDAFYKKNVNALMEGKTLKIPQKPELVKLSKKQAHTQFYRQMAVWEGRAVPEPEPVTIIASEPEALDQEASDTSKLTLVSPSDEALSDSALLTANSVETEKLATENQQLQERLANLEKQFAIMQEMMAIKDQQLAAMQNAQLTPGLPVDTSIDQDNLSDTNDNSSELVNAEAVETLEVAPEQEISAQAADAKKITAVKETQQAPVAETSVNENSGPNYYYLGTGLLVLLGFGWLIGHRRRTEEEINENSIFSSASEMAAADSEGKISTPVLDKKTDYDVGTIGESSFLSEFTLGDFDVFETDQAEVDPSSETDVYLAYGRYQQAEELMRHAINEHPEKDEYKLKLLEIFYASENEGGFENYAKELDAAGKQTDINFWSKVSAMGSELIPASVLFSSEQGEAKIEATDVPVDDYLKTSSKASNDDVDAVTEAMTKLGDAEVKTAGADSDSGGDADFDLRGLSMEDSAEEKDDANSDKAGSAEQKDDIESVDFDFDLSQFEAIDSADDQQSKLADELETFDFNSSSKDEPLQKSDDSSESKAAENNDFDFDFAFDDVSAEPGSEIAGSDENVSGVSDLTDRDEIETKIDLAKAYIDMGDEAAARGIAQEVLAHGNDAQKSEAQAILKKLS